MKQKRIVAPALVDMPDDETVIRHLELRHPDALKLTFTIEPGRTSRRLRSEVWFTYHDTLHKLQQEDYDHHHKSPKD